MVALEEYEEFVREKVSIAKYTHKQLSYELQQAFPDKKGFSVKSIKRFCSKKGIKKNM